ncbi:hypothetical protein OG216_47980 (plasmid) [Streptomycetaceae bacterium NBC_01309]
MKQTPAQIADGIAEGVRDLNLATQSPGAEGLRYPGDAYSVLGNLSTAASRLPQSLHQLDTFLVGLLTGDRLRSDDGSDPQAKVADAVVALEDAAGYAQALREALGRAQSALTAVAYDTSNEDFDGDQDNEEPEL